MKAVINYDLEKAFWLNKKEELLKTSKIWQLLFIPGTGKYEVFKVVDQKEWKELRKQYRNNK